MAAPSSMVAGTAVVADVPGSVGGPGGHWEAPPRPPSLSLGGQGAPVPWGWRRALHNGEVVYFSPSGVALVSLPHVVGYLLTSGTCKCGLECPFRPEAVFDFDPKVPSVHWPSPPPGLRSLCKRRLSASAVSDQLCKDTAKRRKSSLAEWTNNSVGVAPPKQHMMQNQSIAINRQNINPQHSSQNMTNIQQQQLVNQEAINHPQNPNPHLMSNQQIIYNQSEEQILNNEHQKLQLINLQKQHQHQQEQEQLMNQQLLNQQLVNQQLLNQQPQIINVNGTMMLGQSVNKFHGQIINQEGLQQIQRIPIGSRIPNASSGSNPQSVEVGNQASVHERIVQESNQQQHSQRAQPPWKQNKNNQNHALNAATLQQNIVRAQVSERVPPLPQQVQYQHQPVWSDETQRKKHIKKPKKCRMSGSECPNVDVRNIPRSYPGPSFIDDPTGYLAQQTALLNSTISRQNNHIASNRVPTNIHSGHLPNNQNISVQNIAPTMHHSTSANMPFQNNQNATRNNYAGSTNNILLQNNRNSNLNAIVNESGLNQEQNVVVNNQRLPILNQQNGCDMHGNQIPQNIQHCHNVQQINNNSEVHNTVDLGHLDGNVGSRTINLQVISQKPNFVRNSSGFIVNADTQGEVVQDSLHTNCHGCLNNEISNNAVKNCLRVQTLPKNIDFMENITVKEENLDFKGNIVKEDPVTSSTFSATQDGTSVSSTDFTGPIQGGTVSTSHKSPLELPVSSPTSSIGSRSSDTPISHAPSPVLNTHNENVAGSNNVTKRTSVPQGPEFTGFKSHPIMATGNTQGRNTITSVLAGRAQTALTSVNNSSPNHLPQQYQGSVFPYSVQSIQSSQPNYVQSQSKILGNHIYQQKTINRGGRSPLEMVQNVVSNIQVPHQFQQNNSVQMVQSVPSSVNSVQQNSGQIFSISQNGNVQMISNNRGINNMQFVHTSGPQVIQNIPLNNHQINNCGSHSPLIQANMLQSNQLSNVSVQNQNVGGIAHNQQMQHNINNVQQNNQLIHQQIVDQNQQNNISLSQHQLHQNKIQLHNLHNNSSHIHNNMIQQKLHPGYNQGHILVSSGGQILMGGNFHNVPNLMPPPAPKSIMVNGSTGNVIMGSTSNIMGNNVIANSSPNSVLVASNNRSNSNLLVSNSMVSNNSSVMNARGTNSGNQGNGGVLMGNCPNVVVGNNANMLVANGQNLVVGNNQNIVVGNSQNMVHNQNVMQNNQNMTSNTHNMNNQNSQSMVSPNQNNMLAHGMLTGGSNIVHGNQNMVGNNGNVLSGSSMMGQQTVLVNTLPTPFVLQPGFTSVDGQNIQIPHIVGNVIHQQSMVDHSPDSTRTNQGNNFLQRPAMLSPESKRKNKKRKNNQPVTSMLQISQNIPAQFSQQGFQLSPGLGGLTLVSNKGSPGQILVSSQGNQGQFQGQHINLLQPLNVLGSTVQQLIVPQLLMTQDAALLQDASMPLQLQIQNVNGQNMLAPCQGILAGTGGMLLRAPSPQTKNFISPGGGQFIVNGQVSPLMANVSPGQSMGLYSGSVGLVVPPHSSAQNNSTFVQQNTTIVQQQTTMLSNNTTEQNTSTVQSSPNSSQYLLQSVSNQIVDQNNHNGQNSSNPHYVLQQVNTSEPANSTKYSILPSVNNQMVNEQNTHSQFVVQQQTNARSGSNSSQIQQNTIQNQPNSQFLLQSVNNPQRTNTNPQYMLQSVNSHVPTASVRTSAELSHLNSCHSVSTQTAGQGSNHSSQGSVPALPPPDTTTHSPRSPERAPSPQPFSIADRHAMAMVHCVSSSEPDSAVSPEQGESSSPPQIQFSDRSPHGGRVYMHNSKHNPFQTDIKNIHSQHSTLPYGHVIESQPDRMRMDSHTENAAVNIHQRLQIGDLVWGSARGFPAWPGKIIPAPVMTESHEKTSGMDQQGDLDSSDHVWVRWFGARRTLELVSRKTLQSLTEGLDAHHSARRAARKSRKLNPQLESAIQEAMSELDRVSPPTLPKKLNRVQTLTKLRAQKRTSQQRTFKNPVKIAPHPVRSQPAVLPNLRTSPKSEECVITRLRSSQR